MTPHALLESVKGRFITLLHDEPPKLDALLDLALQTYQDKAGCIKTITLTAQDNKDGIDWPADWLELMSAEEDGGDSLEVLNVEGKLKVRTDRLSLAPFTVNYLVNLAGIDKASGELPNNAVRLIGNYLEALIAIPNTERIRHTSLASQLPVDHLKDTASLEARLRELEEEMENQRVFMPMMVF